MIIRRALQYWTRWGPPLSFDLRVFFSFTFDWTRVWCLAKSHKSEVSSSQKSKVERHKSTIKKNTRKSKLRSGPPRLPYCRINSSVTFKNRQNFKLEQWWIDWIFYHLSNDVRNDTNGTSSSIMVSYMKQWPHANCYMYNLDKKRWITVNKRAFLSCFDWKDINMHELEAFNVWLHICLNCQCSRIKVKMDISIRG